jgi:hypothetical protein
MAAGDKYMIDCPFGCGVVEYTETEEGFYKHSPCPSRPISKYEAEWGKVRAAMHDLREAIALAIAPWLGKP